MTDPLLEVIEFHRIVDIRYRDGKRYRVCGCDTLFEGHVWTPPAQHLAEAIRAAGQTRTDRRQVIYAPDGTVSMWAAELTSMSDIYAVCDEFREVLTLTGEWETAEVPATEEPTNG